MSVPVAGLRDHLLRHDPVLEEHVARHAGGIALWGGLVYAAFAPFDAMAREPVERVTLVADLGAAGALVLMGAVWRRSPAWRRHANAFLATVGLVVLASLVGSLAAGEAVGRDFVATELNVGLVVLTLSALLLSWRWLLLMGGVALVGGSILLRDAEEPTVFVVFLSMFAAAGLVHGARLASVGAALRAQAALEEAQAAARIGSLERDLVTGKGHWSPTLRALFELPSGVASLTAAKTAEFIVPEDRARLLAAYTRLATEGARIEERFDVVLPSGARRTYRFRGHRVVDARGRPKRIVATVQDETAMARAERLEQEANEARALRDRLAATATLAAGAAHEFNNPLMYATGALDTAETEIREALARSDVPAPAREALDRAARDLATTRMGLDRMATITRALHRATRPGREALTEVDASALAHAAVASARPLLPPGVAVHEHFDATAHAKARPADAQAILAALLANAGDALASAASGPARGSEPGEIDVATREEGDRVVIEVSDNGPGVDPAFEGRLFTPFFTTRTTREHPGLSLSIAHQAARDQGGDLTYARRPGGGATFRLRLPRWPPAAARA